jgi:hypothetical protein
MVFQTYILQVNEFMYVKKPTMNDKNYNIYNIV